MLRPFLPALTLVAALAMAAPAEAATRGIPASDGQPMLWPTRTVVQDHEDGQPADRPRYGFVDTAGAVVVDATYSSYSYCADADGRPAAVLAGRAGGWDLIGFTGELIGQAEYASVSCIGTQYLLVGEVSATRLTAGVIDAATGEVVLAPAPGRTVTAVTSDLINVSRPSGEYFLDLTTRVVTPHPGWVTDPSLEAGAPGVPAAARRTAGGEPTGKLGYVGRGGGWLVAPEFDVASAFRSGFAVVERDGRATFLDTGFHRVGGDWDTIRPVTVPAAIGERVVGYWVEAGDRRALLGPDLEPVVASGPGQIDCEPTASGACVVIAPDGLADLVELPQGGAVTLPEGFTRALTPDLVTDRPSDKASPTRIRSLATGRTLTLEGPSNCRGVGELFATCNGSVVVDAAGDRSEFTSVAVLPDPAGGPAYYWVTTETAQGILDPDGRWRYRQRR